MLYKLVYIVPLLFIVILFTLKLGARKHSEREGMVLKLLSGVMMLLLGLLLLLSPQLLTNVIAAILLVFVAIVITWGTVKLS